MRSVTFRNIALGILALAVVYHLGARSVGAQTASVVSGLAILNDDKVVVLTPSGDVYARFMSTPGYPLLYLGNFWSGTGPVPVQRETFGALKNRYRVAPGAAQPAPQDR